MLRSFLRRRSFYIAFLFAAVILTSAFQAFELANVGNAAPVDQFVNFESAHVHPLDFTPDSTKLLAVNTANNSLEVFAVQDDILLHEASIPVGIDPVTVRARTNTEVWVVNVISDEISIVDLSLGAVVRSLVTEDEPSDVVFAGSPQRAFVSCAHRESIQIFDLGDLSAAPTEVLLIGEQPRAMAVSPDGTKVYTAFFESGNGTTVVPGSPFLAAGICSEQSSGGACTSVPNDVTLPVGPYGGVVPVPNNGAGFQPPLNPALPPVGAQSLVVRKTSGGQWLDDNGGNWTNIVSGGAGGNRAAGWDMPDRDVAVLDANTLSLSYQHSLGNILMAMAVNPVSGVVSVVGTDATNEIRFEPNLNGRFLRVNVSQFTVGGGNTITDMNPHLDYLSESVPPALRQQSIGDPRGIAWTSDGSVAYVTGMGSNNVIRIGANGVRLGGSPIRVGQGPTGILLDEARDRAYVLNKFDGTISSVDLTNDQEIARADFFDPTPMVIKKGRPHLYNTHTGSGTGHISCGSCHVDGKWDRLAWDLGDPSGSMDTVGGVPFHPFKGLKTTQSLIDIVDRGTGNLHWRGDKASIHGFAGAFQHLQGLSAPADSTTMSEFGDFLAATWYVPNPFRTYRPEVSATTARERIVNPNRVRYHGTTFQNVQSAGVRLFVAVNQNCAHCHVGNTGRGDLPGQGLTAGTPNVDMSLNQNMAADLRSTYRKIGFFYDGPSTAGFGLMSDGAFPTNFNRLTTNNDYFGDYENELLSWSGGIYLPNCTPCGSFALFHASQDAGPAVGHRRTLSSAVGNSNDITFMRTLVDDKPTEYGMIVKGIYNGETRGFTYLGSGNYQSDMAGVTVSHTQLVASAQAAGPLSWTIVHPSTAMRMGVDRDADGILDQDDETVTLSARAILEGPFDGTRMRTDLLNAAWLPDNDPYGMGATIHPDVRALTGPAAPVDWALVELRDAGNAATVVATEAVLIRANGQLMTPSGEQTIAFRTTPAGNYHVAVRHRNHLGIMTFQPIVLGQEGMYMDLSDPVTATWGIDARKNVNGAMVMWMGDVNGDGVVRYTGANNDRDPILSTIGGVVPTANLPGYLPQDVNMDGVVKYTGPNNDRDPVLQNIGGTVPTNVKVEQLP